MSAARPIVSPRAGGASQETWWRAVVERDTSFDGQFYYSVATTGVYCRPSCAARLPKRSNVQFHVTRAGAEAAGFRACKRCRPDQASLDARNAAITAQACRIIESSQEAPKLEELAAAVGVSPYHFHRIFRSVAGVTPKAYATAQLQKRVRDSLTRSATVTEAIYDAGFGSNGRFYATSSAVLGMTPTDFRKGAPSVDIRFAIADCSLGSVLVAATGKGVCAILLGDDPEPLLRELRTRFPKARLIGADRDFEQLMARIIAFIERPEAKFDLPLDVQGTAFQHRVWQALRDIPAGTTATYAEIAKRIGKPKAVRAVGAACGANPVAVAIPCHRVVRSDGGLSGYRWGVVRKRMLIGRERKGRERKS